MFIILQLCFITLAVIKTDAALSTNQSFIFTAYYIKKCTNPAAADYDVLTKPLGNCAAKIGVHLDCLNNTKNNTIYYHPCPYLYYKSGVIPVSCKNGIFGKVDYASYCVPLTSKEQIHRINEELYKAGVITQWQYQYKIDAELNSPIINAMGYYIHIIDAAVCFFGFILLLVLIPLKNRRVMLHRNLIFAVAMRDVAHIVMLEFHEIAPNKQLMPQTEACYKVICSFAFVASQYFVLAEIAWMFNEGFFQFRQFFFVFITKSYMWVYFIIGWFLPAIFVFGIFVPLMFRNPENRKFSVCWSVYSDSYYAVTIPMYIIIAFNLLILFYLMWIILSKLKSGIGSDLEKSRKSTRSFLILVFLLGGGYIFVSSGPNQCIPYQYISVLLLGPQGTYFTIFQVFISKEVRNSAKVKINRLMLKLSIQRSTSKSTRSTSRSTRSTSISMMKRLSTGIFVRKQSDLKFNAPQRTSDPFSAPQPLSARLSIDAVNANIYTPAPFSATQPAVDISSNVVNTLNYETCYEKNGLQISGTNNGGFVNELQISGTNNDGFVNELQ